MEPKIITIHIQRRMDVCDKIIDFTRRNGSEPIPGRSWLASRKFGRENQEVRSSVDGIRFLFPGFRNTGVLGGPDPLAQALILQVGVLGV